MARKKVKLAWMKNENSRVISLKKRRLGLMKKVKELTILCDVKACLIMCSPNEVEPMVWPSVEPARDLLDDFFALPDNEKNKKDTNLESYLKEKTRKIQEQLKKSHTKNMEYVGDKIMVQLNHGRKIVDLNLSETYKMLSFSKDKINDFRKKLGFMEHLPLRDPPMNLHFEAESKEFRTTTSNDVFLGGLQDVERARKSDEAVQMINIGNIRDNQTHYLMDQWFFESSKPHEPIIHPQMGMDMVYYNGNSNTRNYLPYKGSSSNGNPNLEMEPVGHQVMSFHDLVGPISQPLQYHNMNNDPRIVVSQPMQYPFYFMNHENGVRVERSNMNNGDPQFQGSNNNLAINDGGFGQEQPPNGTTAEEGNIDATSFDINRIWPEINNNHF